jgi:hypothetical protein
LIEKAVDVDRREDGRGMRKCLESQNALKNYRKAEVENAVDVDWGDDSVRLA